MSRFRLILLCLGALLLCSPVSRGDDAKPKPLKVLFITGGGYHDYARLAPFLCEEITKRANVQFDVLKGSINGKAVPSILKDPKLGEGYDAIVYDLCYGSDQNLPSETYSQVFDVTKSGKPTVLVHCAMHCFRPAKDWAEFAGMRTHRHEQFGPFSVHPADKDNAITKTWPQDWKTTGDEQYVTDETYPDTTKLLIAVSPNEKDKDGQPIQNVVAWEHMYGKGRVFGTTLGHDMKTSADPDYLQLLANGLLWSADKLDENGKPKAGFEGPGGKTEDISKKE